MVKKTCKVCEEAQSKYKCPICLTPYCSLTCFKKHKEIPCGKPSEAPAEEKFSPGPVVHVEKPFYVDDTTEVLQPSQLETIVCSSEIRDAVKNEELQKLIYQIACAPDAKNDLDKAMEVESFRIFTQKILSTISPENE